jgi:hypothetical protein
MAIKQRPDSPTNNFATLNPLTDGINLGTWTLDDGNLHHYGQGNSTATPTIIPSTRPIYFELIDLDSPKNWYVAFSQDYDYLSNNFFYGSDSIYLGGSGTTSLSISTQGNATFTATVDSTSFSSNEVIGVYANPVTLQIKVYAGGILVKDFVLVNTFTSGKPLMICPSGPQTSTQSFSIYVNFGQDPTFGGNKTPSGGTNSDGSYPDKSGTGIGGFFYDPPAGALALCTANLPEMTPTVNGDTPQDYFKTVLYTGNGSTQSITGVGFQSDFVWIKNRSAPLHHILSDSVRGANNALYSSVTNAEYNSTFNLTSFDSDGFSVGSGTNTNSSGDAIVAWCFRAGGPPTADNTATSGAMTANSVSLNGTLQSSYTPSGSPTIYPTRMSINTDAGFSIVKYQGILDSSTSTATIPHGLASADFCIIKNLDNANTWVVSHTSIEPNVVALQDTGAAASTPPVDATYGQITSLNSNTVTITRGSARGDNVGENLNSWDYIMYCWHSVEGYSKFGSYFGNGSTDGPFVYCGFRPAFVIVKRIDAAQSWAITDNKRTTSYNPVNGILLAESYAAEQNLVWYDFLSNGFKARQSYTGYNASGGTYIYMAFAEQPFNYANAR